MEIGFLSGRKPLHYRAEGGSLKNARRFLKKWKVDG